MIHDPLGSDKKLGRTSKTAVPKWCPREATKGSNESATDKRDLIGCIFTKNCLYRIGERCSSIDQLGRLKALQSSEPAKARVANPVVLHMDRRRTVIPSESIGRRFAGKCSDLCY